MFLRILSAFLIIFFTLNLTGNAQISTQFTDIPYSSGSYNPGDSLKIYFNKNFKDIAFNIRLFDTEKKVLDTLVIGPSFSWFIPILMPVGAYSLRIQHNAGGLQTLEINIRKQNLLNYHYQWQKLINNAAFYPRDGAGLLKFKNKFWIFGGWHWLQSPTTNNEIYSSDDGINWTFEKRAPWEGRHVAGWTIFKEAIWVIGGIITGDFIPTISGNPMMAYIGSK